MIKLLGIPFDGNSSFLKGPALAPARIRQMDLDGSANAFCERGREVVAGKSFEDLGDINFETSDPESAYQKILQRVKKELTKSDKLITLGGDHSISYPIIEAYAEFYPQLHILHFDAHADLYENFDNNPYSHASPFARLLEKEIPASLTQVGIRTLNTHQKEQASRYKVKVVEMKNYHKGFLKELKAPLYISVDLDVLDPAYAPGLSHYEPGGMSSRELIRLIQSIPVPVVGADIVELNPTRDVNDMTAMVAYKIFKELASKMMD